MLIAPLFGATFSDADIAAFSDRAEFLPPQAAKYLKSIAAGRSRSLSEFMGKRGPGTQPSSVGRLLFVARFFDLPRGADGGIRSSG